MQRGNPGSQRGGPVGQGSPGQQQNIFYQIANGEIPSKTVFENDAFRAVLDKEPATPGHVLILPKQQVQITPQFDEALCDGLAEAVQTVSKKILQGFDASGTSVFVANGAVAGQNAPHVLIHVIPRRDRDSVGLTPPPKEISQEAFDEAATRLQEALGVSGESHERQSETGNRGGDDVDLDAVQDKFS